MLNRPKPTADVIADAVNDASGEQPKVRLECSVEADGSNRWNLYLRAFNAQTDVKLSQHDALAPKGISWSQHAYGDRTHAKIEAAQMINNAREAIRRSETNFILREDGTEC